MSETVIFNSDDVKYSNVFSFNMTNSKNIKGIFVGFVSIEYKSVKSDYIYLKTDNGSRLVPFYRNLRGWLSMLRRGDICSITLIETVRTKSGNDFYKFKIEVTK